MGADGVWLGADVLVLTPTSIAGPVASHLRARRSAPSSSSSNNDPSSRIEHEEIPENIAKKGTVAVIQWAAHQQLIKVSTQVPGWVAGDLRTAAL